LCLGSSANITASAIGGGAISYQWSPANWLNTTTGSLVISNPTVSNTYIYIVKGTDDNGCYGNGLISITVYDVPTVDAGENVTILKDNSKNLQAATNATNPD